MNLAECAIRLVFSCPDRVSIVAAVTGFIAEYKGWILKLHTDPYIEKTVLMRGLGFSPVGRVFIHENGTMVFA